MKKQYSWCVIGAGPAGIAAVGKLIDAKVSPQEVLWLDPAFKVGDFGTHWRQVSSNTKVKLFVQFLEGCRAFRYDQCPHAFSLHDLDPEQTCTLYHMADPLAWVTEQLQAQVDHEYAMVDHLTHTDAGWNVQFGAHSVMVKNVILAIGAEPKKFKYDDVTEIELATALDPDKIKSVLHTDDTVAVFGSSHSAVIAIRHLVEFPVKQVINFYRSPLRYAEYVDNKILFDNTGLKGDSAVWAKQHLEAQLPTNLIRLHSTDDNIKKYLPQCNKAIYTVGFNRRSMEVRQHATNLEYDAKTGIIAHGLFGFGIAFPETTINHIGELEQNVGLWKFMQYLDRVLPIWLTQGNKN